MKKLVMMAVVAFSAISANAQNPDALKQVLSCKDYQEAQGLITSNLSSFIDEEKAKAYNKLVDLAMDKFDKENNVVLTNQVTQKNDPYDKAGMNEAAVNALKAAMECEKYDQLPNAKGKVKPRFHSKNAGRLLTARNALVTAGQDLYNEKDYAGAQQAFGAFVDSRQNSLFAESDFSKETYYNQIAYFAALAAYFNKDYTAAPRYADICMSDKEFANDAVNIKASSMKANLQTREDSVKYLNDLKKWYETDPSNESVFSLLAECYQNLNQNDARLALIQKQVTEHPSKMSWAIKGESDMAEQKWAEAIESYKKSLAIDPEFIQVQFNLALCLNNQAITIKDANAGNLTPEAKALLQESIDNLNQIKAKDPDHLTVNWPYTLYQAYYLIGDEENAKALESLIK